MLQGSWEIPKSDPGTPLRGRALGVAQYVVGQLGLQKRVGIDKTMVDDEPSWLNMEAFKAAKVLLREVSAFYHADDLDVKDWGHAFVYHASEINIPSGMLGKFKKGLEYGRWVHISALVEHLYSVKYKDLNNLPFHRRGGFVRMVPLHHW